MKEKKLNKSKINRTLFYGYIIVAASFLIVVLDYGSRLSFGVFFKPMLNDFGWTRALTSGALTLSMVGQGIGAIVMGRLNDKLGPRFVMTLCGILLGAGFLLMSLINGVWQLYLFYGVIFGIGMGGAFVALLSTVARWFVKRRGLMTGLTISGIGIGQVIFPPVSNWLISTFDWKESYLILGSILLVIGVLLAQLLKRDPGKVGLTPDGDNQIEKLEVRKDDQGFSIRQAIRTRQYWMTLFTFFSMGYVIMSLNVHLVPHITDLGISSTVAANVFAVMGGVSVIGGILMGSITDRLGTRMACIISFFIMFATSLWLAQINEIWAFFLFAALYGIGYGGASPLESTMVAELFGMKSHGLILGTISFGFTIGGAIGPFVTGFLFDRNGNYILAFLMCAIAAAVSVLLSATLKRTLRPKLELTPVK